jgi:hypothetical protein
MSLLGKSPMGQYLQSAWLIGKKWSEIEIVYFAPMAYRTRMQIQRYCANLIFFLKRMDPDSMTFGSGSGSVVRIGIPDP